MEKIFYMDASRFPSSTAAVEYILSTRFQERATIARTENGKPYLQNTTRRLFFSVSHTKKTTFIAFSDENVGVDAELIDRDVRYPAIVKRFPVEEREEITSVESFLTHWTVKESAVKWLGGTLAHDLGKLSFTKGVLLYQNVEIPVYRTTLRINGHILTVCSERDFTHAELIQV